MHAIKGTSTKGIENNFLLAYKRIVKKLILPPLDFANYKFHKISEAGKNLVCQKYF